MTCSFRDFDYGIDVTLSQVMKRRRWTGSGNRYNENGYKLDIQAKSTAKAIIQDKVVKYDLDVDAYDDLRETNVGTPRILVLLVLPKPRKEQVQQTEDVLCLRRCCYWSSLKGHKQVANSVKVRVELPREGVFSESAIRQIMKRIRQGKPL